MNEPVEWLLKASVILHECRSCKAGYLDHVAEDAKDAAIRRYLESVEIP